jgi:WD40 repeat protein
MKSIHTNSKLAVILILALVAPTFIFAQQPEKRILVEEEQKKDAAKKPEGPRAARPELVLQTGVTDPVAIIAFSPDGQLLASMSFYGGAVKLWEAATGRELITIHLGERSPTTIALNSAVCFQPDGSLLSVSAGALKQWDSRTGKQIRALNLNKGEDFGFAAFSPDARSLVTINNTQQSLTVWDTTTGRQVQAIAGGLESTTYFHAAAFSHDGRTLATGEESRGQGGDATRLVLRDVAGWRVTQTIKITEENLKDIRRVSMEGAQPVRAIRFSPDGRTVSMAIRDVINNQSISAIGTDQQVVGRENTIRIWDATSGREIRMIKVSDTPTARSMSYTAERDFALSPDGKQMVSVSNDRTAKLFDTATGRNLAALTGHTGEVTAVAFSADGKQVATAGIDSTVRIWDVSATAATGRADLLRALGSAAMPVESLAFGADGRTLAVGGAQAVNLWDMTGGAALRTVALSPVAFNSAEDFFERSSRTFFSADGRMVAATDAGEVRLLETKTGREVKSFPARKVESGSVSPDGKLLAVIDKTAAPTQTASAQPAPSKPAAGATLPPTTPDPKAQKDKDKDKDKKQKDPRKQMEEMQREMMKQMEKMAKSDSGQSGNPQMTMPTPDQMQKIMDAATRGEMGKVQEIATQMAGSLAPGLAQPAASVRLLDVSAGSEVRAVAAQAGVGGSAEKFIAFSPDGQKLASATGGRTIKINDTATGKELFTLAPDRGFLINSLAWSPDSRLIASGNMETRAGVSPSTTDFGFGNLFAFTLKLWDVSDPNAGAKELRAMTGHTGRVTAIAFSPDGRLMASGGDDASIKLWDTATGREVATLTGHTLGVSAIDFSPDGKLIASGSADGSARVWDLQTSQLLVTLASVNRGADWLAVTPGGLFDGTPGAWNQILWRFSPNIFDVSPVEVFFSDFFYPGLLADIYSGKRPKAESDVSQKDRRQPVVSLARPDGQAIATARAIKVRIDIGEPPSYNTTPAGGRDVRLFRNGTLVKLWRGDVMKGQKQATLEATVPIVAGENRLTAYAFNRDNVKSADAMLTVTGGAELQRKGTLHVLTFGVNLYANEQYNLKYAVADATSFGDEVRAQQTRLQNFERVEVIRLLDKDATKENILLALKRLSSTAQPEDGVMIYFAGHGAARGSRFYLVPHDLGYTGARASVNATAIQLILSRSISDIELEAALEGLDAGQLLMVIDACNSGQALEAEEKRRGPMNSKGLAQLAYEKGMYILTAAQSFQAALEAAQLGHGYLTFALIEEGLKTSAADRDAKDGQVHVREWFNYASERVPQMQEKEIRARILLQQEVAFVEGEEKIKDPSKKSVQRPRVFYRRELESRPLVIARP